jgi:Family of unknown function (DUF6116)
MMTPARSPVQDLVGRLAGRLRFPWVFALLVVLFVADLLVPDPIPFVDELMLGLLTFLVGSWRTRKKVTGEASHMSDEGEHPPRLRN